MCEYIDKQSVTSMPLLDQLVNQRWLSFLAIDMCCHLINGITSLENDEMDKIHPLAQHNNRLVLLLLLSSRLIHIPLTMRLCNSRILEVKEICPRGNNKVIIYFLIIMINVYYSCYNCINRKLSTCVNTQTNRVSLVCLYLTNSLIKDG